MAALEDSKEISDCIEENDGDRVVTMKSKLVDSGNLVEITHDNINNLPLASKSGEYKMLEESQDDNCTDRNIDHSSNGDDVKDTNSWNDENDKNAGHNNDSDKDKTDPNINLTKESANGIDNDADDDENNELFRDHKVRRPKRIARIFDDSDSDNQEKIISSKPAPAETLYSDSKNTDEENQSSELEISTENIKDLSDSDQKIDNGEDSKLQSKRKSVKKRKVSASKETSNNEKKQKKEKLSSKHAKISSLISSESESELNNEEGEAPSGDEEPIPESSSKLKRLPKNSKKVLDNIQSIQSEQQRLIREMEISIPYHKPKSFTLQEFLQRRSALPSKISTEKPPMVMEEVENYSKIMKERIQQSVEFFVSESESDNEKETDFEITDNNELIKSNDNNDNTGNDDAQVICDSNSKDVGNNMEFSEQSNSNACNIDAPASSSDYCDPNIIPDKKEELPKSSKKSLILALVDSGFKPVLGGDPKKLIDLETGELIDRKPTGVEKLMERAMLSMKKPKKNLSTEPKTSCNILAVENGKMETVTLNINTRNYEENLDKETIKPRANYIVLKKQLEEVMRRKRMEELKKRKEETEKVNKKCEDLIDGEDDEECVDTSKEDSVEDEEGVESCKELDNIDEEEDKIENFEEVEKESDVENEHSDTNCTSSEILEETGNTQGSAPIQEKAVLSQIPLMNRQCNVDEDELMALCSGMFGGQELISEKSSKHSESEENENEPSLKSPRNADKALLLSTDDDVSEHDNLNDCELKRKKKFRKKNHKRRIKLDFSDEEDDYDEDAKNDEEKIEEECESNEDLDKENENIVYYDSEENEIVLTKEDKAKLANKFFEQEAELSGSEVGSSDEDEAGLDNYEKEFVDKEEEYDTEKLHTELEKIHARKMLDADIRAVRQLKEFLLPDEETDGVGRQRVFKWKNLQNTFTLDDEGNKNGVNSEEISNNNETDEQYENMWRKMRYERERFLKEQSESQKESIEMEPNVDVTVIDTKVHKLQSDNVSLRKNELDKFLIAKNLLIDGKKQPTRGSFLVRDKVTLHKLAGLTNNSNSLNINNMNAINISSIGKSKNFVFKTLTAEECEANRKRKAEEQVDPSCSQGINYIKKPKLQPRREKCIIDLLQE